MFPWSQLDTLFWELEVVCKSMQQNPLCSKKSKTQVASWRWSGRLFPREYKKEKCQCTDWQPLNWWRNDVKMLITAEAAWRICTSAVISKKLAQVKNLFFVPVPTQSLWKGYPVMCLTTESVRASSYSLSSCQWRSSWTLCSKSTEDLTEIEDNLLATVQTWQGQQGQRLFVNVQPGSHSGDEEARQLLTTGFGLTTGKREQTLEEYYSHDEEWQEFNEDEVEGVKDSLCFTLLYLNTVLMNDEKGCQKLW